MMDEDNDNSGGGDVEEVEQVEESSKLPPDESSLSNSVPEDFSEVPDDEINEMDEVTPADGQDSSSSLSSAVDIIEKIISPPKEPEIVSLSDDDEEIQEVEPISSASSRSNGHSSSSAPYGQVKLASNTIMGLIEAVSNQSKINEENDVKKSQVCLNQECESFDELLTAPTYALTYFGIPSRHQTKKLHRICTQCLQIVEDYMTDSRDALEKKESLFDIEPFIPKKVLLTIDVDDDSDESEVEDPEFVSYADRDLDFVVNQMVEKLDLRGQVKGCEKYLDGKTVEMENFFEDIEKDFNKIDDEIEAVRKEYCSLCEPKYESMILRSVDIDTDGNQKFSEGPSSLNVNRRELSRESIKKELEKPDYSIIAPDEITEVLSAPTGRPILPRKQLAPTPAIIPRINPKIGDKVYAMKGSQLSDWVQATVADAYVGYGGNAEYKVTYEVAKKGGGGQLSTITKILTGKHLAYNRPCPFVLPVGTRIIAIFIDEFASAGLDDELKESHYYCGVVAEPPKNTNSHRYLVFFDDGYAQYVDSDHVLLVCETSKEVWWDVHPDTQEFIKDYINKYPERPMVRLQRGTVVTTEWNGKWWIARVVQVDCSLVKMHFEADNRYEWIYRGSTRLSPLYNQQKRKEANEGTKKTARRGTTQRFTAQRKPLTIEYQYNEEDFPATEQKSRAVAKKSTSSVQYVERSEPEYVPSKKARLNANSYALLIEYEGKMLRNPLPRDIPTPNEYIPHKCGPSCVLPYDENDRSLARPNQLSTPLFLGFQREIAKYPKRTVFYRAPCGRRIRDPREMMRFLNATDYNLAIDYFSFDANVDCLSEFRPIRNLYHLNDLSYGKENLPISCANALDNDYPEYVEYSTQRLPGTNVFLNLDDNFLVCCDCTDNCEDKSKCACQQLTIEGTAIGNNGRVNPNAGYQHRRLYDHLVTGIYECNKRCKCKMTCMNRVAQFSLRNPLQVFKTSTKGWGIRPLYDIPHGAFICVYAGQLLTEQGANEDGTQYGDEYLAELDYIEVVEGLKEGYEEDVVEPDAPSPNDDVMEVDASGNAKGNEDDEGGSTRHANKISVNIEKSKKPAECRKTTRELFGAHEDCYIMDAKSIGNIGRYLNHSCKPNVFVQNVFVDTHDLRFPWVSFFAFKHIRAGTELTWDYNYDIGSVPGKKMYCFCGTMECRGRLL